MPRDSGRNRSGRAVLPLLLCWLAGTTSIAAQSTDNELWLDQNISLALSRSSALRLQFAQRNNENVSHLFEAYAQVGLSWRFASWLNVTPAVRHVRLNPFDANASFENRVIVDVGLQTIRGRWKPGLRTRFERRFLEAQPSFTRLRLRPGIEVKLPVNWNRPPALVLMNDFFFDFRDDRYNRNRFTTGVSFPLTPHFSLQPYYMLESSRLPALWDHDNIWGLSLSWSY